MERIGAEQQIMRIITVIEDNIDTNGLCAEHGICVYAETDHHKLIVDAGQSAKTWDNARAMGIDIESVDTVILSHGHYDHSGGLMSFMENNTKAQIYIHEKADGDFYSRRTEGMHYIGIDKRIVNSERVNIVKGDITIDSELSLFGNVSGRKMWPKGNDLLFEKINDVFIPDTFDHEQYLVIRNEENYILVSGCAHKGIPNILNRFFEIYGCDPTMVISGFHTIRKSYDESDINDLRNLAVMLNEKNTVFYTGHCTDHIPFMTMKEIMGDKLRKLTELSG